MKVSGRETTSRDVVVEIDKTELIREIERLVIKICPSLSNDAYVRNGFLYIYDYTHPHNNDDVYRKDRQATAEEEKWLNWMKDLKTLLNP